MSVGITNGNTFGSYIISTSLTPVAVAAATVAEQNFTITGLKVGDVVVVAPPSITAGTAPVSARVSAANTLTVAFVNATAGSLTPAAGTYSLVIERPERLPLTAIIGD